TRTATPTGTINPTPTATATASGVCAPNGTMRQTTSLGDYWRNLNGALPANATRQLVQNVLPGAAVCQVDVMPFNNAGVTSGTIHAEIWTNVSGAPGAQIWGGPAPSDVSAR